MSLDRLADRAAGESSKLGFHPGLGAARQMASVARPGWFAFVHPSLRDRIKLYPELPLPGTPSTRNSLQGYAGSALFAHACRERAGPRPVGGSRQSSSVSKLVHPFWFFTVLRQRRSPRIELRGELGHLSAPATPDQCEPEQCTGCHERKRGSDHGKVAARAVRQQHRLVEERASPYSVTTLVTTRPSGPPRRRTNFSI